jgi:uncharacterized protein YgfB (UPF0149 family)
MNFEYINQISQKADISIDVSEYHGKISACLCFENWKDETLLPKEINADVNSLSSDTNKLKNVLLGLIAETHEKLNDSEMTFYPLLSPDSESLTNRTLSLSNWCQGFIDGFGFSIAQENISINLEEQGIIDEIIEDFSQISKLTSASVMNEGGEELAYMEVVEYVRVGAQLIFEESKGVKS